jgi:uncharacterized protein (AIM24 family)
LGRLIGRAVAWIAGKLGLLALIIALILVATWLRSEWSELRDARASIAQQESARLQLRTELDALDRALATEDAEWRQQIERTTRPLREELDSLQSRLAQAEPKWQRALSRFSDIDRQARETRRAADEAKADAERLAAELRWWDRYIHPRQVAEVEAARAKARLLDATARSWQRARAEVAPLLERSPVAELNRRNLQLQEDLANVSRAMSPRQAELRAARERLSQQAAVLDDSLAAQRERVARDPREQLIAAVRSSLPLALAILCAVLLAPLLVKTLVYFAVAPLAERLPPIQVLSPATAPPLPHTTDSAVSLPIDLPPGEELLLQPEFLQSSSGTATKDTQWLLNSRLPFASLASGLCALTRVRPAGGDGTQVVVASRRDASSELAVIQLPDGASMVVSPRALAGIAKAAASPLIIGRHWQLATPQAWLTLRLRHLVFHGPCRLIIKGRRGVHAEQPRADQPRIINQTATLAFSSNLEQAVTRCETFMSYLRGQDSLFNDRFSGGPGVFVHEVAPVDESQRSGKRGIEGLVDAALKAFGI